MEDIIIKRLDLINSEKDEQLKYILFRESVNKCGHKIKIGGELYFLNGKNIIIGDNVIIGEGVVFIDTNTIKIGNNVHIGNNVIIYPGVFIPDGSKIKQEQIIL